MRSMEEGADQTFSRAAHPVTAPRTSRIPLSQAASVGTRHSETLEPPRSAPAREGQAAGLTEG